MTVGARVWPVRISAAAQADIEDILVWTFDRFGDLQLQVYAETLSSALQALSAGPDTVGAKARSEIANGLYFLHVARKHRKGRQFIMFRVGRGKDREAIDVLRVLHDSMDLIRHLPQDEA